MITLEDATMLQPRFMQLRLRLPRSAPLGPHTLRHCTYCVWYKFVNNFAAVKFFFLPDLLCEQAFNVCLVN